MCNLLSLRIGPNEHARAPRYSASVDARFHDDQLVAADCPSGCIWVDGNKSMVMALSLLSTGAVCVFRSCTYIVTNTIRLASSLDSL
jgi:hypothetical protein